MEDSPLPVVVTVGEESVGPRTKSALKLEYEFVRTVLLGGGPADSPSQVELARRATANIRDADTAASLAERLTIAVGFHHLFARMTNSAVGPCHEGLAILDEIEFVSG